MTLELLNPFESVYSLSFDINNLSTAQADFEDYNKWVIRSNLPHCLVYTMYVQSMRVVMLAQMTAEGLGLESSVQRQEKENEVRVYAKRIKKRKWWFSEALPYFYLGIIAVLTQHLIHVMGNVSAGMVRHPQASGFGGNQRRALPNSWSRQSSALWNQPLKSWPECQTWLPDSYPKTRH